MAQDPKLVEKVLKGEKSRKGSVTFDAEEFAKRHKNEWINSSTVKNCQKCAKPFTITNRKHHCRDCGKVFCSKCSNNKLVVNGILKRACVDCYMTVMRGGLASDTGRPSEGPTPPARLSHLQQPSSTSIESTTTGAGRSGSFTGSVNSDRSSNDGGEVAGRVSWVDAMLLIKKTSGQPRNVEAVYPKKLPGSLIDDIVAMAMPQQTSTHSDQTADYSFCFIIRTSKQRPTSSASSSTDPGKAEDVPLSKVAPALAASPFVYCYVAYRQSVGLKTTEEGTISTLNKQALVLVSLLPIPNLAYSILGTLESMLYHVTHQKPPAPTGDGGADDASVGSLSLAEGVYKTFEVAMDQIRSTWNALELAVDGARWTCNLALPLFGEIFQFKVVIPSMLSVSDAGLNSIDFASFGLGAAVTFTNGMNIISQFGTVGLLPHLWTLWELLVQGKDILVLASSPDACAEMVIALSSLVLSPNSGYAGGNLRPFITRMDSDVTLIADAVKRKRRRELNSAAHNPLDSIGSSYIIGFTDPTLLLDFRDFAALVVVAPKRDVVSGPGEVSADVLRKTERRTSFSGKMSGANKKLSLEEMADESLLRFNPQYSVPIRFPGPGDLEPNTYTSSRLTFAEDVQGGRESTSVLPRGDGLSLSGLDPLDTPAGSDSNSVDNAAVAAIKKKNKSSRTPSFFSRSYVAWKKVYDRGVYTPGLLVLPGEPSASPLSTSVCKRLKKLSVHEYLVLGNHLLRDHFDELTANFLKPQIEVFEQQKQHQQQSESDESKSSIRNATAAGEDGSARDASAMAARSETAQISLAPPSTFSKDDIEIFVQELVHVLLDIMSHNRHSMRIALLSIVIALIYLNMKGPPVVLVAAVMIIQIPDEEQINIWKARLRARINAIKESTLPLNARLAKRNAASASAAAPSSSATTSITAGSDATTALSFKPTANFSGVWKRGKVVNFEEFLVAQGVAYVQRKLAMSMVMVHTITMDDELTVFRLQEKGGPLVTDSTIVIGGDPVETELGPKKWLDTVSWEGPDCILLIKELLPDKNMEVQVRRRLINAGKGIRQDSFLLDKSTGKKVETTSFFDFEGSSPNDKPATVLIKDIASAADDASTRVEAAASGDEAVAATSGRRDLSGVWTRERTHNVDAYVGAQGAGFVQRKMAASMAMVHTLTMNADLSVLRLQEVGGPLNSDIVYTVDSDPMDTMIMKRKFKDTCTWVPGANPPTLKIVRKHEDDDFSLVLTRYIEEDGGEPTLVLVGAYVDHATKQEIVGTSWFKKTASTPNPPPTSSAVNKKAKGTATPASTTAVTSAPFPANSPAAGTPVEGKASTSSVDGDDGKLKRNLSTLLKVDLSGVWEREGDSTTGMLQFSQSVRHTITMDPPFFSTARIEEKSGPVDTDYSFDIDSEYIPTEINGRRFMERCYWEGEALVQKRVAANDYELVMMRYLEDAGGHAANSVSRAQSRLRFVTIKKNLKTGEETESSQFFKRVGPSPRSLGAVNKGTGTSKSNSSQLKSSVSFGPNEEIPDVAFVDYTTAASNDV